MPILVPSTTAGTGTTLARYCSLLGEQLGSYVEYVVSTTATSGEAARLVLADELRDDEPDSEDWVGVLYVYARSGAQIGNQRRLLNRGYEGPLSGLILSRPWASALQAGTTIAVSEPLPVRRNRQTKGLVDLVNEALHRIDVEVRISFTGNGTRSYSLAGYDFIRSKLDILRLMDRYGLAVIDPYGPSPYAWDINADGVAVTLETGYAYSTADTFQVVAAVRGDRWVSDGTAWSYTLTPGLVADTDQGAANPDHVVAIGMVKGLRYLMRRTLADRRLSDTDKQRRLADLSGRMRPWARTAANVIRHELPKRQPQPRQGIIGGPVTTTAGFVGVP